MKRNKLLLFAVYCMLSTVFLWGCGGGAGSPGSKGTEDTGVEVDATITPTYLNSNTYNVDAFQDQCDPGPPPEYEEFTDHNATATINARLLNPNRVASTGVLYIEKYTVEFRRSSDSIGAPPIQSDTRYETIVIYPPTGGGVATLETTVAFFDLTRKEQYRNDMLSGQYSAYGSYINNYTAIYTFKGKNEYGSKFSFKAYRDFAIGNYINCD